MKTRRKRSDTPYNSSNVGFSLKMQVHIREFAHSNQILYMGLLTKLGWMLAMFFFCVFMDRDKVEVHKHAK